MTYAGAPQSLPTKKSVLFLNRRRGRQQLRGDGLRAGQVFGRRRQRRRESRCSRSTKVPMQRGAGMTRGNPQVVPLSEFKELVKSYLNK